MNDTDKKFDDSVEAQDQNPVDESALDHGSDEIEMTSDEFENINPIDGDEEPTVITMPILPLRGTVVFPHTVVPLAAAQARSLRLIDEVMSGDRVVGLLLQNDSE